eukprot:SM000081S22653  [mRNA]  locus=s81:329924:331177:- [translate_table: standard]
MVEADVTKGADELAEALGNADAVVCATGFAPGLDLTSAWRVDNYGTVHLADACKRRGIRKLVLVSSLLTNAPAWGQAFNTTYIGLNLFGLVLIAKRQAEKYLEKSGLDYTIVRPGGLSSDPPFGNLVMSRADTLSAGRVSRDTVAEVAVEALLCPEASYKIVEIVSQEDAPFKPIKELFASVA